MQANYCAYYCMFFTVNVCCTQATIHILTKLNLKFVSSAHKLLNVNLVQILESLNA